ncbi:MAG: hypothetical protein J0H68_08535 [Sphingobacteriia bacterium]|nr:hypothetical protein [Sphingobacteriia bacterium]
MKKHNFVFTNGYDVSDGVETDAFKFSGDKLANDLKATLNKYKNVDTYFLGDKENGIKPNDLYSLIEKLAKEAGEVTFFLSAHGTVIDGHHCIQLEENYIIRTKAVLDYIKEQFGERDFNIVISSCHSPHLAKDLAQIFPNKGNVLILASEEEGFANNAGAYFYKASLIDYCKTYNLSENLDFDFKKSTLSYIHKLADTTEHTGGSPIDNFLVKNILGSLPIIYESGKPIHDVNKEVKDALLGKINLKNYQAEVEKIKLTLKHIDDHLEHNESVYMKSFLLSEEDRENLLKKELESAINSFKYPEGVREYLEIDKAFNREEFTVKIKEDFEDDEDSDFIDKVINANTSIYNKEQLQEKFVYDNIDKFSNSDYYYHVTKFELLQQQSIIFTENRVKIGEYVAMEDLGIPNIYQDYNLQVA